MIKFVILDQSKPISLILKNKKIKNPKFVNCIFKKLSTGGAGRNGGTNLITSWKCNYSI